MLVNSYQVDSLFFDFILDHRIFKLGDDGYEDGWQRQDMKTLRHAQYKQLHPRALYQFYLCIGWEVLKGTDGPSPVYRQEKETGSALTNVARVQKDRDRRWNRQVEWCIPDEQ